MRYAIFTDIHANLEALEAVLAKIDQISQEEPIDQIWFLGDLVGYGPNPNECIEKLRARTDVIIAGNHDWAAVGKIDLEDFSEAARISAEWTAEQLTPEHRQFLTNLPERIDREDCVLVHGSPYGPLWEYLTTEVLAERSFQHFSTRYCFVGHTHVPVIFVQPESIFNIPTIPLGEEEKNGSEPDAHLGMENESDPGQEDEATELLTMHSATQNIRAVAQDRQPETEKQQAVIHNSDNASEHAESENASEQTESEEEAIDQGNTILSPEKEPAAHTPESSPISQRDAEEAIEEEIANSETPQAEETTPEATIAHAEDRLNEEIEELLALLGLTQSMISVTNEMLVPPEGDWDAPIGQRAIINPGGVGQPRDGDARAAFMIYDTESGFTFYRVPYTFAKTQEKIIKAGLPPYLATRLAYGR